MIFVYFSAPSVQCDSTNKLIGNNQTIMVMVLEMYIIVYGMCCVTIYRICIDINGRVMS